MLEHDPLVKTHQEQREEGREEPDHDTPADRADGGADGLRGGPLAVAVGPAPEDLDGDAAEAVHLGHGKVAVDHGVHDLVEERRRRRRLEERAARGPRRRRGAEPEP